MPTLQVAYYEMDTFHTTCVLLPYPSLTRDQCYTSSLSLMSLIPSSPLAITSSPTGGQHPQRGTAILPPTGGWGQPFPPPSKRDKHTQLTQPLLRAAAVAPTRFALGGHTDSRFQRTAVREAPTLRDLTGGVGHARGAPPGAAPGRGRDCSTCDGRGGEVG